MLKKKTNALLKKFELKPDYIVSCNPTNMEINTAHPGQAVYRIKAIGKMTNIGNASSGDNAILKMQKIINCIQSNATLPEDKRLGKANMIVSSISSDPTDEAHSVPYMCQALLVRQFFKNEHYSEASLNQQRSYRHLRPQRGVILDCRGRVLAASNKVQTIFAEPRVIKDAKSTSSKLAPVVDIGAHIICQTILESRNPGYVKIKTTTDYREWSSARKICWPIKPMCLF